MPTPSLIGAPKTAVDTPGFWSISTCRHRQHPACLRTRRGIARHRPHNACRDRVGLLPGFEQGDSSRNDTRLLVRFGDGDRVAFPPINAASGASFYHYGPARQLSGIGGAVCSPAVHVRNA